MFLVNYVQLCMKHLYGKSIHLENGKLKIRKYTVNGWDFVLIKLDQGLTTLWSTKNIN